MSNPKLVMLVEHDMNMVRHIADWVTVMAEGKIVAEGKPAEVMSDQAVIDAYLGSHANIDLGDIPDIENAAVLSPDPREQAGKEQA